jgi:hypothetical protein
MSGILFKKTEVKKYFIKTRNKLIFLNNRLKRNITFEIQGKIPALYLNEKYETPFKWCIRFLTVIGIFSSLLTIPFPFSIIMAIVLGIVDLFAERIFFKFNSIYIQPIPEYELESWIAMLYNIPLNNGYFGIGLVFNNDNNAKKIFKWIRSLNYFESDDINDDIKVTFVLESETEYSVYIYPSFERRSVIWGKEKISRDRLLKGQKKEQQQYVMSPIMCRSFPLSGESKSRIFLDNYNYGSLCEIGVYSMNPGSLHDDISTHFLPSNNGIVNCSEKNEIRKYHVKIIKREDLTPKDMEYHHGRMIIERY